jgi:FixJ family two-component response regulator
MTEQQGSVLIVDDDAQVCRSLVRLLTSKGYKAQALTNPHELLSIKPIEGPACIILDLRLGKVNGFDVFQELNKVGHGCPVIFLTAFGGVPEAVEAMRLGAEDFLEKPYDPEVLLSSVSRAIERSLAHLDSDEQLSKLKARAARLTPRERQVVTLVMSGLLNKEIADKLGLAEVTVKIHRAHAMRRLGAHNPTQLARLAGLLDLGPTILTDWPQG